MQAQGFFPQPMQRPIADRFLDFLIDGVSISTNFFQSLVRRFGLLSVLILNLQTDVPPLSERILMYFRLQGPGKRTYRRSGS
jgi:hypothetical protein